MPDQARSARRQPRPALRVCHRCRPARRRPARATAPRPARADVQAAGAPQCRAAWRPGRHRPDRPARPWPPPGLTATGQSADAVRRGPVAAPSRAAARPWPRRGMRRVSVPASRPPGRSARHRAAPRPRRPPARAGSGHTTPRRLSACPPPPRSASFARGSSPRRATAAVPPPPWRRGPRSPPAPGAGSGCWGISTPRCHRPAPAVRRGHAGCGRRYRAGSRSALPAPWPRAPSSPGSAARPHPSGA